MCGMSIGSCLSNFGCVGADPCTLSLRTVTVAVNSEQCTVAVNCCRCTPSLCVHCRCVCTVAVYTGTVASALEKTQ